jgi:hypothetical protein
MGAGFRHFAATVFGAVVATGCRADRVAGPELDPTTRAAAAATLEPLPTGTRTLSMAEQPVAGVRVTTTLVITTLPSSVALP